ncbi:2-hydroxychromene-2-carboxylate isomerase [Comamonadaceae bacterium OH2310_COT-174]|nr:2-hydroxychromene-2-carboxylate isomerase [Comamonadaceae bacterium OH2310_COT-174]
MTINASEGSATLACYYSLSSPWAYFAGPQLQDIVRRHRVRLVFKPFDFQAVVPQTGGIPLRTRPAARRSYHQEELARWSDYLGLPIVLQPRHYPQGAHPDPHWNKHAGWMLIAAQAQGLDVQALSHALLRALWLEERDTALAEVRIAVANENGYDGAALQALEQAPATQALYRQYTQEALEQGIFGAPTYVLDGVRYWGQDRLGFVDRALAQRAAGRR